MQTALYRAERPEVLEDIIGQTQIVRILRNQIKKGTVSQAYLFSGTHGTGKTSTARILAKALNCVEADKCTGDNVPCGKCENCMAIKEGRFVDVVELDAASNNGVDDLRAIIELTKYPPTVGKYKVFIIDEVHMLSTAAENAFLKTLEEPPEYAVFILATTDPQKVRDTIRSRCMQLNFRRVSEKELEQGMKRICDKRGVAIDADALQVLSEKAAGSVRDALSLLEQCMAADDDRINRDLVLEYTGSAGDEFFIKLTDAVSESSLGDVMLAIDEAIRAGKDAKQLMKDWLAHYRNIMLCKYIDNPEKIVKTSLENIERFKDQSKTLDIATIEKSMRLISEYINLGKHSDRPRILLETLALRLSLGDIGASSDELASSRGVERATRASQSDREKEAAVSISRASRQLSETQAIPTAHAEHTVQATNAQEQELQVAYNAQAIKEQEHEVIERFEPPVQSKENLEADMKLARATVPSGESGSMWKTICARMIKQQSGFAIVQKCSRAKSFSDGELLVAVKKNKLSIASQFVQQLDKIAKDCFGSGVYVKIIAGEIDLVQGREEHGLVEEELVMSEEAPIEEQEYMSEGFEEAEDVTADLGDRLEDFFGMKPKINDK